MTGMAGTYFKISEIFYSLQGEGMWAGTPMHFVRLAGCSMKCDFCDTPDREGKELKYQDIIEQVKDNKHNCNRVLLTGGEPTEQDSEYLCKAFASDGFDIHLETNGMRRINGPFDWITLSPKTAKLDYYALARASEVKFLMGIPGWEDIIKELDPLLNPNQKRFIMPLSKGMKEEGFTAGRGDLDEDLTEECVAYCLKHPKFHLSLQLHKLLEIK